MKATKRDDAMPHDTTSRKKRKTDFESSNTDNDQITTALRKIRCFIGISTKFSKAVRLLLNLCEKGHITPDNSDLFFQVVSIAMIDKATCLKPELRKGYCKLVAAVVELASQFSSMQRKQLEVYQIWAICRNELNTDDSFVFNKNMNKLRELAIQLPICLETDQASLITWKEKTERVRTYYREHHRSLESEAEDPGSSELNCIWTERECLAARREAIIDWCESSKSFYKRPWACTAIDISITTLNENKDKFCESQRVRIEALLRFSKDQKMRRQQGPSTKEKKRDSSTFDEARKDWSNASISTRGMVGSSGDHKSEAWLG